MLILFYKQSTKIRFGHWFITFISKYCFVYHTVQKVTILFFTTPGGFIFSDFHYFKIFINVIRQYVVYLIYMSHFFVNYICFYAVCLNLAYHPLAKISDSCISLSSSSFYSSSNCVYDIGANVFWKWNTYTCFV